MEEKERMTMEYALIHTQGNADTFRQIAAKKVLHADFSTSKAPGREIAPQMLTKNKDPRAIRVHNM